MKAVRMRMMKKIWVIIDVVLIFLFARYFAYALSLFISIYKGGIDDLILEKLILNAVFFLISLVFLFYARIGSLIIQKYRKLEKT